MFYFSSVLAFFLSCFTSFYTKHWHMLRRTYRHDILHYIPVLFANAQSTWHWLTMTSSTFSFLHLFPLLPLFISFSFLICLLPISPFLLSPIFSEPLSINDGGHMTKGTAPGHVCVSTALPDTMTRTHATWLRMLNNKHSWYICLNHLGGKIHHVFSGSHLVGLRLVQPDKAQITSVTKYHK